MNSFVDLSTCGDFSFDELVSIGCAHHVKLPFKSHPFIKSAEGGAYPYTDWEATIKGFDSSIIKESDIVIGAKSGNLATAIRFGAECPFKTLDTTKKVELLNVFQGISFLPYNRQAAGAHAESALFKTAIETPILDSPNVIIYISNNFGLTKENADTIEKNCVVAQILPADGKALMLDSKSDMAQIHAELYDKINAEAAGATHVNIAFSGPIALAILVGNVLASGAYAGRTTIYDFVNNTYVKAYDL